MKAGDRAAAGIAERFGENLARCRKRAGISQEELSARAGLHRTEIGMLERGARLPQLDTLIKLAGGLEVEPSALVEGLSWRPGGARSGSFRSDGDTATRTKESDFTGL
jgi:transcriptional regulator with XRE-family HTH domain